jgi:hypothetical protein
MSIFHALRDNAKKVAEKYSLQSDAACFNELWELKKKSDEFEKEHHAAIEREVRDNLAALGSVGSTPATTRPGFALCTRVPMAGRKFVIFSDHHMAWDASRQNWFVNCGNRDLYREVLDQYFDAGYTLIENGDVEELVIFEPHLDDVKARAKMTWAELDAHRETKRLAQLGRVLDDNRALYEQIRETFHAEGRYFRTAGNHDLDLQKPEFLALFRKQAYPGAPAPADVLLREQESGGKKTVKYLIAHGHQFDKACTPRYGARLGETISECLAWAYQGPDRRWRWEDETKEWATGKKAFANRLVADDYKYEDSFWNDAWFGAGAVLSTLDDPNGWEYLFKHNVAWEYFESDNPQRAISSEVKTGDEWFKYRHMDERAIRDALVKYYPDAAKRPSLVLGHSHEPRFMSDGFASYLNAATAGRFHNLIWALEIDRSGVPTMVSWSRPAPKEGLPVRRTYARDGNSLRASATTTRIAK